MMSSFFTILYLMAMLVAAFGVQNFPQIDFGDLDAIIDQVENGNEGTVLGTTPSAFADLETFNNQVETVNGGTGLEQTLSNFGNFQDADASSVKFEDLISQADSGADDNTFDTSTFQTFRSANINSGSTPFTPFPSDGVSLQGFSTCFELFFVCVGGCPSGRTCAKDGGECSCLADILPTPTPTPTPTTSPSPTPTPSPTPSPTPPMPPTYGESP